MSEISNISLSDPELVDLIAKRFVETENTQTVVILPCSGDDSVREGVINKVHGKVQKYLNCSPVSSKGAQIFFPVFMGKDKELLNEFDSTDLLIIILESEEAPRDVIEELKESLKDGVDNQKMLLQVAA
ncbi:hypothetical protein [Vibrio europaeus]|uniref:hypothetical protein n=1 Tax=Vibrio europaeus TaxID=300876 RepID=UPI00233F5EB3|nr:hypothetical protein [Vibrio europaeus]MDC5753553.1 hypothetical protein [Vibrio europaeus]MDC5816535.1 hypothetical protein [Vibrio europaeus]